MKVYFIPRTREVYATVEEAISEATKDMIPYCYLGEDNYVISLPMIIKHRYDNYIVITIYDKKSCKLHKLRRKIKTVNVDNKPYLNPVKYLGTL